MLRPDVIVLEPLGLFLGKMQDLSGSLSKFVKTINLRHSSPLGESGNYTKKNYHARYEDQQTNEVVFPRHMCIPFISPTLNVLPQLRHGFRRRGEYAPLTMARPMPAGMTRVYEQPGRVILGRCAHVQATILSRSPHGKLACAPAHAAATGYRVLQLQERQ